MFLEVPFNTEFEVILLLEDKYDINYLYYHKLEGYKKVKCGCMNYTDCFFCEKGNKPLFLSLLPLYIRNNQETNILYLKLEEYNKLLALFQSLVTQNTLKSNLSDIKECIFSLKKNQRGVIEFAFKRKHSYKKMNLDKPFDIKEYLKKNYPPIDSYGKQEGDFVLRKIKYSMESDF